MYIEAINPYIMTDEKEEQLWEKAIFVFDTCSLLDLYFLPKTTRQRIYTDIFDKLDDRLWLPNHVQYEYLKNREKTITKPIKEKYNDIRDDIKKISKTVSSDIVNKIQAISNKTIKDDKYPYLEQTEIKRLIDLAKKFQSDSSLIETSIIAQIEKNEKEITDVINDDDVLKAIKNSFSVGREFLFNEIIEITKEGKHRYEFKIPPGYGDLNNKEKKGTQIFGDLIVWMQILEYSKEKKLPIIFITSDIKKDNDWCYLDQTATEPRISSPREELIKEIKDYSGVEFWMYNLPQLLYKAEGYLKSTIKEKEIQTISQILNTKNNNGNHLKFECDKCKKIHTYHKSFLCLNYECMGGSERGMGTENLYVADETFQCECENIILATFEIWEYPVGIHNYDNISIAGAKLLEPFSQHIDFYNDGFYVCHECSGNKDDIGNYVDFTYEIKLDNGCNKSDQSTIFPLVSAGNCQWCNTLHIECPQCRAITSLIDDDKIECQGGCGLIFIKESENTSDGDSFSLKLANQ